MIVSTGKETHIIEIEPDEEIIIRFNPKGYDLAPQDDYLEFAMKMIHIGSNTGLMLGLPGDNTYKAGSAFVVMGRVTTPDKVTIRGMEFVRVNGGEE